MIKATSILASLIIITAFILTRAKKQNKDGLYIVHIICRNGERTPEKDRELKNVTYPKDPYKNFTYYPVGYGQLTNKGKQRIFNIGLALKERYKEFLGNFYIPWQVIVRSSNKDRTQATAQLIMAGMYPPKKPQVWNKNFAWQPIPIHTTSRKDDKIFFPQFSCARLQYLQSIYVKSEHTKQKYRKYFKTLQGLRKETGINVEYPEKVMELYNTLKSQKEYGLKLPSWSHNYYPEVMQDIVIQYWEDYAPTDEIKKLSAGHMLKRIIDDTTKKINGNASHKQMKFYLYSSHDSNIVSMLELLGVYDPHIIPYGAYIAIEIHKKGKGYIVKIYYNKHNMVQQPKLLHLPKCSKQCGFKKFVNIYNKYFPNAYDC